MSKIPNRLECAYCRRHYAHGGECSGKKNTTDEIGCLIFKADEKGCIRNADLKVPIPLYGEFPLLDVWNDNYEIGGIDTQVRIKRIHGLSWNTKKGYLYIHCNCDYYVNEFHEDYTEPKDKTILRVIK